LTGAHPPQPFSVQAKLEERLYGGTLRRGGHHAGCGCAVGEQGEEVHIQPITGT